MALHQQLLLLDLQDVYRIHTLHTLKIWGDLRVVLLQQFVDALLDVREELLLHVAEGLRLHARVVQIVDPVLQSVEVFVYFQEVFEAIFFIINPIYLWLIMYRITDFTSDVIGIAITLRMYCFF